MTIAGASEKIAGKFFDKGGHHFNILHPDYGCDPTGVLDSAAGMDACVTDALAAGDPVLIPAGTFKRTSVLTVGADHLVIQGVGNRSIISHTGAAAAIDVNGMEYCKLRDFYLTTATGTIGIDLPFASHWWGIQGLHIKGFSVAGVKDVSSYYGLLFHCDIETNAIGFWGASDANGNALTHSSFRQNLQGARIEDTTSATDTLEITDNQFESARASSLYDVALVGCTGVIVGTNRMESTVGTAHIYVIDTATHVANLNELNSNKCRGSIPPILLGDGTGSDRVTGTQIYGGSGGVVTINSDASDTICHLHGAMYSTPVNNGVRSAIFRTGNLSYSSGITGGTTSPTATFKYAMTGDTITLWIQQLTVTSNTTACTLTGLPAVLWPRGNNQIDQKVIYDNGVAAMGSVKIQTDGTITLSKDLLGTGNNFTAAGAKGIGPCIITYKYN